MFLAINTIPAIVIGRIQGAALGGGSGLAAVCDIVVAEEDAIFGFTETKLGHPAGDDLAICPAEDRRLGRARSVPDRHADSTPQGQGDRTRARRRAAADLDAAVDRYVDEALSASPTAVARAKSVDPSSARQAAWRRHRHHRRRDRRAARLRRRPGRPQGVSRQAHAGVDRHLRHCQGLLQACGSSDSPPADRESRRDRAPHHSRVPRARRSKPSRCIRTPMPTPGMSAKPIVAVRIGPAPARESYLDIAKIIAAARSTERRRRASGLWLSFGARALRAGL